MLHAVHRLDPALWELHRGLVWFGLIKSSATMLIRHMGPAEFETPVLEVGLGFHLHGLPNQMPRKLVSFHCGITEGVWISVLNCMPDRYIYIKYIDIDT